MRRLSSFGFASGRMEGESSSAMRSMAVRSWSRLVSGRSMSDQLCSAEIAVSLGGVGRFPNCVKMCVGFVARSRS